jgi:filamentous hemagglutinin
MTNTTPLHTDKPASDLPNSNLFNPPEAAGAGYLLETDPLFVDNQNSLSSDYLFDNLPDVPETLLQRLSDGTYEQRLVREQIKLSNGHVYWMALLVSKHNIKH